jgi:hypothetical protein
VQNILAERRFSVLRPASVASVASAVAESFWIGLDGYALYNYHCF